MASLLLATRMQHLLVLATSAVTCHLCSSPNTHFQFIFESIFNVCVLQAPPPPASSPQLFPVPDIPKTFCSSCRRDCTAFVKQLWAACGSRVCTLDHSLCMSCWKKHIIRSQMGMWCMHGLIGLYAFWTQTFLAVSCFSVELICIATQKQRMSF